MGVTATAKPGAEGGSIVPIYDFRCRDCGQVVELLVRETRSEEIFCPACQGRMERLPSAARLVRSSRGQGGFTCCGREERCETPPCSTGGGCHRG